MNHFVCLVNHLNCFAQKHWSIQKWISWLSTESFTRTELFRSETLKHSGTKWLTESWNQIDSFKNYDSFRNKTLVLCSEAPNNFCFDFDSNFFPFKEEKCTNYLWRLCLKYTFLNVFFVLIEHLYKSHHFFSRFFCMERYSL